MLRVPFGMCLLASYDKSLSERFIAAFSGCCECNELMASSTGGNAWTAV